MNYETNPNNFTPVNPNQAQYRTLFQPNEHACLDMMFNGAPPTNIDGLSGPPQYCLGRCDEPPIINTR